MSGQQLFSYFHSDFQFLLSLKTIEKSPLFPPQGECQISFKFNVSQVREMGILDHLTCLLRNLYAGQQATVRTLCETTDQFRTEKRVQQGCLLSPCLYAEHMIRNPGLDELQAGIKIATRRISNHRYADDITQMISLNGEEELKNLLMRVKEENEKAG